MDTRRFFGFLGSKFFWVPTLVFAAAYGVAETLLFHGFISEAMMARMSAIGAFLLSTLAWIFANTQYGQKVREEVDKNNFQKFLELMPQQGMMRLFQDQWFEHRFPTKIFENYDRFCAFYVQPGKKFLNPDLQEEFSKLHRELDGLFEKLSGFTSAMGDGESGFPVELIMYNENLYRERARELNELSTRVATVYRVFVDKWTNHFSIPH